MVLLRDILLGLWQNLLGLIGYFSKQTQEAGIAVDPLLIAAILLALTLWLGSGCWASSIASSRRHSAVLSFILGLAVPWVYPLVIVFAMDIKGARARQRQQRDAAARDAAKDDERRRVAELIGREPAEATPGMAAGAGAEPAVGDLGADEEPQVFDKAYFESIARDDQGNPAGPWRVVFGDNEVKVLRILEPLPEVVSVEIAGRDGAPAKFRIPYARITVCEPC
ncbi:MAG: hypothetical protein GX595_02865 [Lentisphaerae bacterium]|nr:hypothetical protein [Lentisphaerota bacterium]